MIGPFQARLGYVIGSESAGATMTAAFSGNTSGVFTVGREMEMLTLYVSYTPKSGQSDRYIVIRLEFGDRNDDLYQIVKNEDYSSDSSILISRPFDRLFPKDTGTVGGTEYKGRIAQPVADKYGRVSVKESGTSNFGTATIKAVITSRS